MEFNANQQTLNPSVASSETLAAINVRKVGTHPEMAAK
jgi:hypothetical protein